MHRKHGVNAALIVQRSLGLRQISQFERRAEQPKWPCCAGSYQEPDGPAWLEIDLARLLADPAFLSVEAQ